MNTYTISINFKVLSIKRKENKSKLENEININ